MKAESRVRRLEQMSGINEEDEAIHIGKGLTDEEISKIVKAKIKDQVIWREKGESWKAFEDRVFAVAYGAWAYFYTADSDVFHVRQIINLDIPKNKKTRGRYAY